MRRHRGWVAAAFAASLLASGCGGSAATPSASATAGLTPTASVSAAASATHTAVADAPPTTPGTATASPPPELLGLYLRSWTTYPSIGPVNSFGRVPLVISNGWYLSGRHTATAAPFPMYSSPTRRAVSQAGLARIVAEAQAEGLLGTVTSFDCPDDETIIVTGGAGPDYLVLAVDGVSHELSSSCPDAGALPTPTVESAAPGTWGAFQRFKRLLDNPVSWLGAEIGPEAAYDPDELAVLVGPWDNSGGTPNPANVVQWPLAAPFASFGVAAFGDRCAVVSGSDAAALLPVVKAANVATVFRDGSGALAGVIVRAFMPGEPDPCAGG